jgi:hypothetical protein
MNQSLQLVGANGWTTTCCAIRSCPLFPLSNMGKGVIALFRFDEERESERTMNEANGFYAARRDSRTADERHTETNDFMSSLRSRVEGSGMSTSFFDKK